MFELQNVVARYISPLLSKAIAKGPRDPHLLNLFFLFRYVLCSLCLLAYVDSVVLAATYLVAGSRWSRLLVFHCLLFAIGLAARTIRGATMPYGRHPKFILWALGVVTSMR